MVFDVVTWLTNYYFDLSATYTSIMPDGKILVFSSTDGGIIKLDNTGLLWWKNVILMQGDTKFEFSSNKVYWVMRVSTLLIDHILFSFDFGGVF